MDLTTRILAKWRARRNADLRVRSTDRLRVDTLKPTAWERLFALNTAKLAKGVT